MGRRFTVEAQSASLQTAGGFYGGAVSPLNGVQEANIILQVSTTKTVYYIHHFPLKEQKMPSLKCQTRLFYVTCV